MRFANLWRRLATVHFQYKTNSTFAYISIMMIMLQTCVDHTPDFIFFTWIAFWRPYTPFTLSSCHYEQYQVAASKWILPFTYEQRCGDPHQRLELSWKWLAGWLAGCCGLFLFGSSSSSKPWETSTTCAFRPFNLSQITLLMRRFEPITFPITYIGFSSSSNKK